MRLARLWPVLAVAAMGLAGCDSLIKSAAGGLTEQLGEAVLGHDDPELVREATPTLLILIDSMAGWGRRLCRSWLRGTAIRRLRRGVRQ